MINVYVYQKVLGPEKVSLDFINRITQIQPCGPDDLHVINGASSAAFTQGLQSWENPEIHLRMELEAYCRERRQRRFAQKELSYLNWEK